MVNTRKAAKKSSKSASSSKKPVKILTNKKPSLKTSGVKKKTNPKAQSKKSQGLAAEQLFNTLNEILIEAKPVIKAFCEMLTPKIKTESEK